MRTRSCTNPSPLGTGSTCSGSNQETRICNDQYPGCDTHFGYEFEYLSTACDSFHATNDISIDDCIEDCQNNIDCVGVVYEYEICKSLHGR